MEQEADTSTDSLEFVSPSLQRNFATVNNRVYHPEYSKEYAELVKGAPSRHRLYGADIPSSTSLILQKTTEREINVHEYSEYSYNNLQYKSSINPRPVHGLKQRPLIKVTVIPNNSSVQKLRKRRSCTKKVQTTVSNQENSIKAKNVYLVVAGKKREKVYEIKTTGSAEFSNNHLNYTKNDDHAVEENIKKFLNSLNMDKRKKSRKKSEESDNDDECGTINVDVLNCEGPRCQEEVKANRSRVRISGKIGRTEDDRFVLKCAAMVDGQPVENDFMQGSEFLQIQAPRYYHQSQCVPWSDEESREFIKRRLTCQNQREANVQADLQQELPEDSYIISATTCPVFLSTRSNYRSKETQCSPGNFNTVCFSNIEKLRIVSNKDQIVQCNCPKHCPSPVYTNSKTELDTCTRSQNSCNNPLVIISVYPNQEKVDKASGEDSRDRKESYEQDDESHVIKELPAPKNRKSKRNDKKRGGKSKAVANSVSSDEKPRARSPVRSKSPTNKKTKIKVEEKNTSTSKKMFREEKTTHEVKSKNIKVGVLLHVPPAGTYQKRQAERSTPLVEKSTNTEGDPHCLCVVDPGDNKSPTHKKTNAAMNWVSAKNKASGVSISIDDKRETYDVTFRQAPLVKHYQGDSCNVTNPMERDKQIQELLGIDTRLAPSRFIERTTQKAEVDLSPNIFWSTDVQTDIESTICSVYKLDKINCACFHDNKIKAIKEESSSESKSSEKEAPKGKGNERPKEKEKVRILRETSTHVKEARENRNHLKDPRECLHNLKQPREYRDHVREPTHHYNEPREYRDHVREPTHHYNEPREYRDHVREPTHHYNEPREYRDHVREPTHHYNEPREYRDHLREPPHYFNDPRERQRDQLRGPTGYRSHLREAPIAQPAKCKRVQCSYHPVPTYTLEPEPDPEPPQCCQPPPPPCQEPPDCCCEDTASPIPPLYQQLILNRNINIFLQIDQFTKQKPIILSRKQYDKVKRTIENATNKKPNCICKNSCLSIGETRRKCTETCGYVSELNHKNNQVYPNSCCVGIQSSYVEPKLLGGIRKSVQFEYVNDDDGEPVFLRESSCVQNNVIDRTLVSIAQEKHSVNVDEENDNDEPKPFRVDAMHKLRSVSEIRMGQGDTQCCIDNKVNKQQYVREKHPPPKPSKAGCPGKSKIGSLLGKLKNVANDTCNQDDFPQPDDDDCVKCGTLIRLHSCKVCGRKTQKCFKNECYFCELNKKRSRDLSVHNLFERGAARFAASSTEVRYTSVTYLKHVTFSSTNVPVNPNNERKSSVVNLLEKNYQSDSLHTLFKGHKRTPTPNLGTSVYSIYSEYSDRTSKSKLNIQEPRPRKPFLRRLMSCLVMRSKTSQVKVGKRPPKIPSFNNSIDSYHINTSLGAIELSSSIYDTSASFYSSHSIQPLSSKLKRSFLSSVRGFLSYRRN
ncbi:uncharacterized protein LOC126376393 [Pectinophora gossypiella]|uniref:uncharacterized protein LOC126376393 n=1 Tax=Pectinophora gossypiella TaxID=13191 RepID=UPI00214F39C3|nr:uncharacterized protein LOC126376393 [Pectinophora gossypiella]